MKWNNYLSATLLFVALMFTNCSEECETTIATCKEKPPTNELCLAYFERWFYNADQNECEPIGYSGCSQWGFETEAECEACRCN